MTFLGQVLLFFVLFYLAMRFIFRGGFRSGRKKRSPGGLVVEEMRKDPVCGTYVPESQSLSRKIGGRTYFFCSTACRDKFSPPGD